nr:MAG: putative RNA dependent RNA polymerase [Inner Mongolia sediment mitovirus 3]
MKRKYQNNQNQFKFWLFGYTYSIITWIRASLATSSESSNPKVFLPFLHYLDRYYTNRGVSEFLNQIKRIRTAYLGYLSGNPCKVEGVRCTSDGIPVALGDLIPIIRGSETPGNFLPFLNTILWCTRALNIGKLPNFSTISEPASVQVPTEIGKDSVAFWRAIGTWPIGRLPRALAWKKYRMSTKAGPNGPALMSSLQDLYALPQSAVEAICVLGGKKFRHFVSVLKTDSVQTYLTKIFSIPEGGRYRKITYFPDKEDKVRVIAILDYFSQESLRPLHSWLYKVLRKIPQDCTFNQGSFRDKLKDCDWYYSIDLTAATDRFPISVISNVLKGALPHSYVDAWQHVMVGYPFWVQDLKKEISYGVGNPMGAYSSWAAFAVTNHYIVWLACKDTNVEWSKLPYCLLGDDIVIGHKEVGERYIEILGTLGVEVSGVKTHKSQYFYEFAKRLIYKNQEITPFPVSAMKESQKAYHLLTNLLREEMKKGWVFREPVSDAVVAFYESVLRYRSKRSKELGARAEISDRITQVIRQSKPADDLINFIIRGFDPGFDGVSEEQANAMLRRFTFESFRESLTPNPRSKRPLLGTLSTQWVESLTSNEEFYSLLSAPGLGVEMIPFLQVYGQVEEKYLQAQRGVLEIDLGKDDWPLILRSITFPLHDDVFVMRTRDLISVYSATVGRKLIRWLQLRYKVSTAAKG